MELINGDSLVELCAFPDNYFDSVVTDPPYGLAFMNKKWDYDVPGVELWREVLRVLKPGGLLLSFGGTRTYHRMVVAIEDAGFEIRDQIQWIYGSGFPKSLDVSKAIDKQAATSSAKQWQGWGTALKPANEPIVLARKPLEKGLTVAENVLKWGTGAINVDASRIATSDRWSGKTGIGSTSGQTVYGKDTQVLGEMSALGRWPANVLFDEEAARVLDEQSGPIKTKLPFKKVSEHTFGVADKELHKGQKFESQKGLGITVPGASRFFYVAKASKRERNAGLEGMPERISSKVGQTVWTSQCDECGKSRPQTEKQCGSCGGSLSKVDREKPSSQNFHPTVKPIRLMEYLCRLITPPGGIILDPFMGSGSTGVACKNLKRNFVGIELDKEYFKIAKQRIGL